jgi:hypothetical protein
MLALLVIMFYTAMVLLFGEEIVEYMFETGSTNHTIVQLSVLFWFITILRPSFWRYMRWKK